MSNSSLPVLTVDASPKKPVEREGRWWTLKADRVHGSVSAVVDSIANAQSWREALDVRNARLYSERELVASLRNDARRGSHFTNATHTIHTQPDEGRLRYNVVRSCIDTAASALGTVKPKPFFQTSDGDWPTQQRAQLLTRYIEGIFYDGDAYVEAQRAFVDACVFGLGAVKLYWDVGEEEGDARLRFERTLPFELLVDAADGYYGKPKQLHHVRWIHASALAEQFPKQAEAIYAAVTDDGSSAFRSQVEELRVVESWHLKSGPKAKDGKHSITIHGATLLLEDWHPPYYPYSFFRWNDNIVGWHGRGLAEELTSVQVNINATAHAIAMAQRLIANPRVFVEASSQIPNINNRIGGVTRYVGRPPVFTTPVAMNAEAYQWLDGLIKKAYELAGIPQMQATAQKPAGLDSAVAIRAYNDTSSVRFGKTKQRWEELFMDLARKSVDMSRRAYEGGAKKLSVKTSDGKFLSQIRWKDAVLEDDRFHMKPFPTNILPTEPAAKIQTVQELAQAGIVPREFALSLLNFPDLEAFTSLETAALEDIKWTISQLLDGKPQDADDVTNLKLAVTLGMSAYLNSKRAKVDPRNRELLRAWVEECKEKLEPPPQPANDNDAGSGGPSGAAPPPPGGDDQDSFAPDALTQARPKNPPRSGLLPNVGIGVRGGNAAPPPLVSDAGAKVSMQPSEGIGMKLGQDDDGRTGLDVMGSLKATNDIDTQYQHQNGGLLTSDAAAKEKVAAEAYALGRAHQHYGEEWAYPVPKDIKEPSAKYPEPPKVGEWWKKPDQPLPAGIKPGQSYDPARPETMGVKPGPSPRKTEPLPAGVKPGQTYDPSRPETTGIKPGPRPDPKSAQPAAMMDAIGGGKEFAYRDGVPGVQSGVPKYGTTTQDLSQTPMGQQMVTQDPRSGYQAIDPVEAVGPTMAALGNINERLRDIEGSQPVAEPSPESAHLDDLSEEKA